MLTWIRKKELKVEAKHYNKLLCDQNISFNVFNFRVNILVDIYDN